MAQFQRQTETVNGRQLTVIGLATKFADVGIPFTPAVPGSGSTYTDDVTGHTRRRFPGGPAANVNAHTRSGVRVKELNGSNSEAGRPFYIEQLLSAPGADPRVVKTFVFGYIGRWRDLKSKIIADLAPAPNWSLRNASGTRIKLDTVPTPPGP